MVPYVLDRARDAQVDDPRLYGTCIMRVPGPALCPPLARPGGGISKCRRPTDRLPTAASRRRRAPTVRRRALANAGELDEAVAELRALPPDMPPQGAQARAVCFRLPPPPPIRPPGPPHPTTHH